MTTALATLDKTADATVATLDAARRILAASAEPSRIKDLRDYMAAWHHALVIRGDNRDIQQEAAELKLRAERRLGAMLAAADLDRGGRPSKTKTYNTRLSVSLADLGVSAMESSRWQKEASVPEDQFVEWIDNRKASDEDITSAGLRQLAANLAAADKKHPGGQDFPEFDTAEVFHTCPSCGQLVECDR